MKVLVLGCGWVGEAFVEYMAKKGASIYVTTTSADKAERFRRFGYGVQVVDFDKEVDLSGLPKVVDYVLTSVPATAKFSMALLERRFAHLKNYLRELTYRKHIFLSSVGVYPDVDGQMHEAFSNGLNLRLRGAEIELEQLPRTYVYRLGGLFGKNRIFAKYFQDKVCTTGDQFANFVHLDDVVRLLALGFERLDEEGIYNIVCPSHPTKEAVIRASAAKYGYKLPLRFEPVDSFQKQVSSSKIVAALDYDFKYSSPLDF